MALLLAACPEGTGGSGPSGGGPAGGPAAGPGRNNPVVSGNCRIQTATESGRMVLTYTLDPTTDSGGSDLTSDISFQMITVPVGGGLNFFTGSSDDGDATIDEPYSIAKTELTYAVYRRVREWAVASERGANGYSFNAGRQGGDSTNCGTADPDEVSRTPQHPVTCVTWYDSVKFVNALSEYCGLTPSYENSGAVMRTGTTNPTPSSSADGFQLPSDNEWELAARYIGDMNNDGDIKDSGEFYPGNYASGATDDTSDRAATQAVAWYSFNASNTNPVQGKAANALGLYDLSGNVDEWTYPSVTLVALRGGSFTYSIGGTQVSGHQLVFRSDWYTDTGVRLVR